MGSANVDMAGPGKVRPITARWVVTGDLLLTSAAHVGGRDEGPADLNVLRDRESGRPLLTGSSLAGALRSHLADMLGGYRSGEHEDVCMLFGGAREQELDQDGGDQSPLIVFDSLAELPADRTMELRDGVVIDPALGTAQEHKLFDIEVLPKGTRFPIRVELIVPEQRHEARLVTLLMAALSGLSPGNIAIGARRARGFGALHSEQWGARRYDLTGQDGWLAWLTSDPRGPQTVGANAHSEVGAAFKAAWPTARILDLHTYLKRVVANAHIHFAGGMLIRSTPTSADAPDAIHLRSGGGAILPGTSLAGVLRARARRILRLVRRPHGDAEQWLGRLFGTEPGDREKTLSASRLRVSESVVQDWKPLRQTRVQIDRFTQGATPTALFEEQPIYNGEVQVRLEMRSPQQGDLGLLLLLLKDLLSGDLVIGGTGSVGRGAVRGTAEITLEDGARLHVDPAREPDAMTLQTLDGAIKELRDAPFRSRE